MRPTRLLPPGYTQTSSINLLKNMKLMLALNLAGLVLLAGALALFIELAATLRAPSARVGVLVSGADSLLWVVGLLGVMALMLVLHEAVHGLFFWLLTGERPVFGIGPGYAYAAAPGWYLPRGHYLWVGIAPLVVLSLVGTGLLAVVPDGWLPWLVIFLAGNVSGAVGDLAAAVWLLRQPRTCLAEDRGDAVRLFNRAVLPGAGNDDKI